MIDSAHEAYVGMDAGGFITQWNPAAEATFGWTKEEACGRTLSDTIVPERFREAHLAGLSRFLDTGEGAVLGKRLELEGLHRDGHEIPIEITISAIAGGETQQFHAFLHDISERQRRERYLEAQQNITVLLAEAERASEVLPRLLEGIGAPMGWEYGAFWGAANERLVCETTWTAPDSELEEFAEASKQMFLEPGVGLPGRVFSSAAPLFLEDVRTDPNFPRAEVAQRAGLVAAVGLPLLVRGEVRGVVEFFSRAVRHPEPELIEMMETLTGLIGRFFSILSEREELRGRLERLALTDELTGLPNRRAWDQGLRRELSRVDRTGEDLCLALIDLDHFKSYNDTHGHLGGDGILRDTADAWSASLRATDLLARYGGEEFALAFPARPIEMAYAVVERLRQSTPSRITCSAGLAVWRKGETAEELTTRADAALYDAKQRGRNRTVIAPLA